MIEYQHRRDGEITVFGDLRDALRKQPFDKVSFAIDLDGRLILRGDGSWEFWDGSGRWSARGLEETWFGVKL